ncbi:SLAP domain-containing protein [Virgibacillus flavescens]|uniref:SLAP domain-containing protein n=1 Tax=Virgibacillus flavescens TaxID=1611422 RepID=UPI003D34B8DD
MQRLIFESKWDKTIAEQDRDRIKQIFNNADLAPDINIQFTPISQAKNHRGELLVMVLIHNTSNEDFSFLDRRLSYIVNETVFAAHTFSYSLTVEKQTSMPWTFIFPRDSFSSSEDFKGGVLCFTDK